MAAGVVGVLTVACLMLLLQNPPAQLVEDGGAASFAVAVLSAIKVREQHIIDIPLITLETFIDAIVPPSVKGVSAGG